MCAPLLNFDCDAATAVLCAYKKGLKHLKGSGKKGQGLIVGRHRGRGIGGPLGVRAAAAQLLRHAKRTFT